MRPRAPRPPLEKAIEADLIDALRTLGFFVSKTSQRQKPKGMTKGIPDLYASHPGRALRLWVEVKRPGEGPSQEQLMWHAAERTAGGTVLIVRSVGDLLDDLEGLGIKVRA